MLAVSLFYFTAAQSKIFLPYLKRWFAFSHFIALMWAALSWQIERIGIELNFQGIELAGKIEFADSFIVDFSLAFCGILMMQYFVQAIGKLPLPEKINSTFVLTARYIALLGELRQKMDIAMRARGFRPGLNRRTLYVTAQSVALLLIHALLKPKRRKWR